MAERNSDFDYQGIYNGLNLPRGCLLMSCGGVWIRDYLLPGESEEQYRRFRRRCLVIVRVLGMTVIRQRLRDGVSAPTTRVVRARSFAGHRKRAARQWAKLQVKKKRWNAAAESLQARFVTNDPHSSAAYDAAAAVAAGRDCPFRRQPRSPSRELPQRLSPSRGRRQSPHSAFHQHQSRVFTNASRRNQPDFDWRQEREEARRREREVRRQEEIEEAQRRERAQVSQRQSVEDERIEREEREQRRQEVWRDYQIRREQEHREQTLTRQREHSESVDREVLEQRRKIEELEKKKRKRTNRVVDDAAREVMREVDEANRKRQRNAEMNRMGDEIYSAMLEETKKENDREKRREEDRERRRLEKEKKERADIDRKLKRKEMRKLQDELDSVIRENVLVVEEVEERRSVRFTDDEAESTAVMSVNENVENDLEQDLMNVNVECA